jgi:hypothetical protein
MNVAVPDSLTYAELVDGRPVAVDWLWHGFAARGNVTLLTSQWKSGKTTLLSVLMARLHTGGELAGRAVHAARAAIVSEESPALWRLRGERLDFGPQARFFCRPFTNKPTHDEWSALLDRLVALRAERGIDLAVIDPLSSFLPAGTENNADALTGALRPLERLTAAGLAVFVLHHPRKGTWRPGQAARGSGALGAYVDILVEMSRVPGSKPDDRRRQLSAWSRFEATPSELVLELSADRCDYQVGELRLEDTIEGDLDRGLEGIQEVLTRLARRLTRQQVYHEWPGRTRPSLATLWRWLECGVDRGLLVREGTGKSGDPFRYAVAGLEAEPWTPDPEDLLKGPLLGARR